MPTINWKVVLGTFAVIVLLSQATPILAVLCRVGSVFYTGLVLPILHSPKHGQVLVLSLVVALGIVILLRIFGKI